MTAEERIAALETRLEELEASLNREHQQVVENRARIEANMKRIEESLSKIEANQARLEQYKAELNEHQKSIEKHHKSLMDLMSSAAFQGAKDYMKTFIEGATPLHEIPESAPKEGPGLLERMTNAEAESDKTIVEGWLEYGEPTEK